ncbi:MAG: FMN reductase [Candidatus Edwardsbacteria bacterium RIFOXYD12_FULL_50_11]|uniref:FMN reductase n=1 Tax=Candidatus Edwardsbacteria bacterium GWF2_54_11 TaxID=1817851 RepID=A0A1F5RC71_9BACT|nr:MAG: FMN reductase [Candidatus Edwardsbacteria bacterium RifOxyC12_full_54_24]OGF07501.1 MAG: FMN reductase [Candidatus Edwardsbacteria bacterium RifOxyA12_full_54_48]OGF09751.1 MAG: FMN reductase [Candidatus Edwardsbacteria bacterium GWE2_54_12]OGF12014.1 MAG: FMN reductase [Candidatus Edwardsbacteria bacterium GWF2_54_11]OGF16112.1 MAG: FMN reductase [Candidatus Edwardsbacteria bacterium RIFOXYD12_FULL_50_11]OGJ19561.1 MAG: FMN reductase [Candidatus Edwardsbacteria bacterium RifOxyB12_ful
MKVVAFNGSPRPNGNTAALIRYVFEELEKEGIVTKLVQLGGQNIHGCRACYRCVQNRDKKCAYDDDMLNSCIGEMLAADGIIIGSPTYYSNVSSETKALIDRAGLVSGVNGHLLKRKAGAAVVAVRRAGATNTFDAINKFFLISEMIVPGSSYWNLGIGREPGAVKEDQEGLDTMRVLGQNLAWLLKKINS